MSSVRSAAALTVSLTFVVLMSSASAEDILSTSISSTILKEGDYLVAGDLLDDTFRDSTHKYWYWRLTQDGDTVQQGAIDLPDNHDPMLGGVIGTDDDGFLLVARFGGDLWKIDQSGSVTQVGGLLDGDGTLNFIEKTADGYYLAGGAAWMEGDGDLNPDGVLVKFSDKGEVLWCKTYDREKQEEIWAAVSTEDGGFILIMSSGKTDKFGSGKVDGVLFSCNEQGEVRQEIRIPGSHLMPKMVGADGNTVLSTMVTEWSGSPSEPSRDFRLMAFSDQLNILWDRKLDQFDTMLFPPSVGSAPGGRLVVIGQPLALLGLDSESLVLPKPKLRVGIFDSKGTEERVKDIELGGKKGRNAFSMPGFVGSPAVTDTHALSNVQVITMRMSGSQSTEILLHKIRTSDGKVAWTKRAKLQKDGPVLP